MSQKNIIEAVIFDWAGTVVDFGSIAPISVLKAAFKSVFNFDISIEEARISMGLAKRSHIKAIGDIPEVIVRWQQQFKREFNDDDVDKIYSTFMPLQKQTVTDFSDPIPGAIETIDWLRRRNILIGSCTGYPRAVMDILVPIAKKKGYAPDCVIACDDFAPGARPGPWMALQNVIALAVNSVKHCIKVDDSAPGIIEGRNAGMWTVGVTLSGNASGLTLDEYNHTSVALKEVRRKAASTTLLSAGADYVVDTIADLPDVVEKINLRLQS